MKKCKTMQQIMTRRLKKSLQKNQRVPLLIITRSQMFRGMKMIFFLHQMGTVPPKQQQESQKRLRERKSTLFILRALIWRHRGRRGSCSLLTGRSQSPKQSRLRLKMRQAFRKSGDLHSGQTTYIYLRRNTQEIPIRVHIMRSA